MSPYLGLRVGQVSGNTGIFFLRLTIGNVEFLVSQYVGNTSFILDGSQESLENCLKVLKLYAKAPGLCVNIETN